MDASVFDILPVIVCETAPVRDESGNIIDLEWVDSNRLMNESILPDGGSVVGMRIFEFDPTYRNSEMVKSVLEVIESGEPRTLVTGQGRAAKMLKKVMKTMLLPTPRGVLCCSHEITDIAKERDEAVDRAELLRVACDSAMHAITISDKNANLLYVNDALCQLTGHDADSLIGRPVATLFGESDVRRATAILERALTGRHVKHTADSELRTVDGDRIRVSVEMNSAMLPSEDDAVFITHIKDVREERRKAHELRDALNRAELATRLKSEFLANMSHEIRTPLNGVLGMAQTLAHDELTPSQAEQVSIILDSGRALMVLLNDILDLSKIEAGRMEMTPVAADIRHKLSGVFKLHESVAKEKGISLKMHVDPSVPSGLVFDPVRVRQCVGNLVSNAIKFTSEGEVLLVVTCDEAADGKHMVTVHVSDTGCGIAPDKLDRIFDSFSQEDGSTTRRFGGTGLGLSISRKLARIMGGDVTVVSEPGRGSVFSLQFQAGEVTPLKLAPRPEKATAPARRKIGLTGREALVVDDNPINIRVARSFLEQHGISASEAIDGNEALTYLTENKVDFVLMDIHMPGLDGTEAFRRLRMSASPNRLTPVIALTADSMHGDREKYLAMGFDGYVSKPIEERALMTAIGQVLNEEPLRAVS